MNKEKFNNSMDEIKLTDREKEKMLDRILLATSQDAQVSKFETVKALFLNQRLVLSLASVLILAFVMVGGYQNHGTEVVPNYVMGGEQRLGLNYNNYYYAMIEKPESLNLHLKEVIGTLKQSVSIEDQLDNLIGSFTEGATVWRVEEYHPNFRIVVEYNEMLYLCENIGKVDDSYFDLSGYIQDANLLESSDEVILSDWGTNQVLSTLRGDEKTLFLQYLSSSVFLPYEEIDFDDVSSSKMNGESFVVTIHLVDETTIQFELIPSLKLILFERVQFQMSDDLQQYLF